MAGRRTAAEAEEDLPVSKVGAGAMIEAGGATSTDIEEYDEGRGAITARVYTDKPEFAADEVSMPRLRLAQGTTPEVQEGNAKPGDWVISGFEPYKKVILIPTMFARLREYRDKQDNKKVLCSSSDFVTGVGTPGGECATCPMNQWGPPSVPGGKGTPPGCSRVFSYVAYSVTHETLLSFDLKRTGMGAAKLINAMIQAKGLGKFGIELSSTSQRSSRGIYYVAAAQVAAVTEEQLAAASGDYADFEPVGEDD